MKVLVLNGPNLDRLGKRQPEIYGRTTLADVEKQLLERGAELEHGGRVHDVLRGRAPVHVAAGVAALLCHLMHERQVIFRRRFHRL